MDLTVTKEKPDLESEIARLEAQLDERRAELTKLREEFNEFKSRYAQVVGAKLAELSEVEQEIRKAERRLLGEDEIEAADESTEDSWSAASPPARGLKKLFWSVARIFHPDHASDDDEARRRHSVMAEASRAYRDGDVESLHALLGDEDLQLYCASTAHEEDERDLAAKLVRLKEELLTIEFGIKRIKQDALYRAKLKADAEAAEGRDALTQMAESIGRQIAKAHRRLAHLS